jgi:cyclomaltodextrinase
MSRMPSSFRHVFLSALTGCLLLRSATVSAADLVPATPTTRPSPEWLRSSVVYEIFPRDFSQAGDFNSITAQLDALQDLGVNVLWLMPIHPIGQKNKKGSIGSPFAVRDFYAINPDYGTTNDFRRFVTEAHKRKMKVILGLTLGHTSWDSVLMAHPDFYLKDASGAIIPPDPSWTDVAGLDYSNPQVRQYMIDMMRYWLKEFAVDGFRCDVVSTVPIEFWESAREELEKTNPQVIILADAGAKPALLAKAFDVDSSSGLTSTLDMVMSGVRPAYMLQDSWEHTEQQFPKDALHLRFTDSHERPRAVARYGATGALAAQVLMLTIDGVPLLYNGMEVGDATESCDPALFEKMPIFWQPAGRPPLRSMYHDLIQLRKQHPAFYKGSVTWLQNTVPEEVVSLLRKDAQDEYVILINFSSRRVSGSIELPNADGYQPVVITGATPASGNTHLPDFNLYGYGWQIYHRSVTK